MFFLRGKFLFLIFFFSETLGASEVYLEFSNEDMGFLSFIPKAVNNNKENPDGNYTQGLYFSYSLFSGKGQKVAFSLAQDLFTPSGASKKQRFMEEGQRPFASYTLLGGDFYGAYGDWLFNVGVFAGFLGESSLGAQIQNFFHKTFKKKEGYPGWDDQVDSSFLASFESSVAYRKSFFCQFVCAELSPSLSLSLGNLVTRVALGGTFRLGRALPDDLSTSAHKFLSKGSPSRLGRPFFWSVHLGLHLIDVYYNALLDQKTKLTGLRVTRRKPQIKEVSFGGDLGFSHWLLRLSFVMRSEEFQGHKPYQFLRFGLGYRL